MAAFSYQHQPFLLDSDFFPNTIKIPGFSEEPNTTTTTTPTSYFSQFYPSEPLHEIPINTNNELSVTVKHSTDQSSLSVVDKIDDSGEQVTQKITHMVKKRNYRHGSPSNSSQSKDPKEVKGKKEKKSNGDAEKKKVKAEKKDQKKVVEEAPKGYIHVRARRGQATDSHSLAERVRRMKISERMKELQALVPGCDKVIGKALLLDEIINYVRSLQNQVEFLSMKLASVNPEFYDIGVDLDTFMVKPEKWNNLASLTPNVEQRCPAEPNAFTTVSNYSLLDSSSSFLLQRGQRPHILSQDNEQFLWDLDDQRQNLINQTGLISNNLCTYN